MSKFSAIITSAPIQPIVNGLDIYESYDLVSQGREYARLQIGARTILRQKKFHFSPFSIERIISAPNGQTKETANLLQEEYSLTDCIFQTSSLLDNIRFSMVELMSREKFYSMPYDEAIEMCRNSFVEDYFDDKLLEQKQSVLYRLDQVYRIMSEGKMNTLMIGHAFFVKLLFIYIFHRESFQSKSSLLKSFEPDKKPYESLEGFILKP